MRPSPQTHNLAQAINRTLAEALGRDPDVVLLGQDIGAFGGVFRATAELQGRFGAERVIDMPGGESGVIGTAVGMAIYGLRPVAEIQFADFVFGAFEQLANELAKYRYRSGGQFSCPVVVRMPVGGGVGGGMYHSQSPEAHLVHTPGLVVVCPSTPADAAGLMATAIESDDPVVFLEPKALYRRAGGLLPQPGHRVPLGKARRVREGSDLTVVTWGAMVRVCEEAANQAASEGVECDIIDPRTLWPLDLEAIAASVAETGRCLIVHEAPRTGGLGAEITALVQRHSFLSLEAPVMRVAGFDTPVPHALERAYLPSVPRVLEGIEQVMSF